MIEHMGEEVVEHVGVVAIILEGLISSGRNC
jgi:hypothetical protein